MPELKPKLALIAGYGELPVQLAESAIAEGVDLTVFALNNDSYFRLKKLTKTYQFTPIEVFPMIDLIKSLGINQITMIGKVPKLDFFKNLHRLDLRLLEEIKSLANMNDDSLHFKLAEFLQQEHQIEVIDQTKYLRKLFPGEQNFTNRKVSNEELQIVRFGLEQAKAIAKLDIGQTIVVQNKSVIAVESIEGTNECIKRGLKLAKRKKETSPIIVCKVSKPNQDKRFDVPTIGLKTLKAIGKDAILAFEANQCFFVDQEASIKYANSHGIAVVAVGLSLSKNN